MLPAEAILFASGNRHKYEEVVRIFSPLKLRILFGPEVLELDVEEDGNSYCSNARLKARAWALASGIPALADDSGVEARALGWNPGIRSARMAATDSGRVEWMLRSMEGKSDRVGRYVAAFALFLPGEGFCILTEGECWGTVTGSPRGKGGFGYDPVFVPRSQEGTFAEIPPGVKDKISHRAIAGYRMMDILSRASMIK